MSNLKFRINKIRGSEKTAIKYYTILALIIYFPLAYFTLNFDITKLNNIFSANLASISGIFIGLLSATFGIIASTENNFTKLITKLGYKSLVYKIHVIDIKVFFYSFISYIMKLFILGGNEGNISNIIGCKKIILFLTINFGLLLFILGLLLLNVSIRYLGYIYNSKL